MPFARETLTQLQADVWANIATRMPGSAPYQRGTVENVLGTVFAGFQNDQLGETDWVSKEAVPWTADGEFQVGWGALKGVQLQGPVAAQLNYQFTGNPGATVYSASTVSIGNVVYTVAAGGEIGGDNTLTCLIVCQQAGSIGNQPTGAAGALSPETAGVATAGAVVSTAVNGTDLETSSHFQTRINQAWANPPQGGDLADYVGWVENNVPAVTRCWSTGPAGNGPGMGMGPGTVTVFACIDDQNHTNGILNGTNGVSQYDARNTGTGGPYPIATGDQLDIANALYPLQPAGAFVFVASPTGVALNIALQEVPANATLRSAITAAVQGLLLREAAPVGVQTVQTMSDGTLAIVNGGTIDIDHLQAAIAAVPGLNDFVMTSPGPADIVLNTFGQLSLPGTISYSNPS